MVSVISGPNDANVAPGKSVGELRSQFAAAFSIAPNANAVLDGSIVSDSAVPSDGQKLVFTLPVGEKG